MHSFLVIVHTFAAFISVSSMNRFLCVHMWQFMSAHDSWMKHGHSAGSVGGEGPLSQLNEQDEMAL